MALTDGRLHLRNRGNSQISTRGASYTLSFSLISSILYGVKFGFSPVYVIVPFLFICLLLVRFLYIRIDLPTILILPALAIGLLNNFELQGSSTNFLLSILGYVFVLSWAQRLSTERVINSALLASYFVASILIADSIYRVLHPQAPTQEMRDVIEDRGQWFYLYKFGTQMFSDSNTTALISLTWAAVVEYINKYSRHVNFYYRLVFPLITLFTFSRSAIVGLAILYLFSMQGKKRLVYVAGLLGSGVILFNWITLLFETDGSATTKLQFLDWLLSAHEEIQTLHILFGYGLGSTEGVIGIFGHNILLTLLIDIGLIGLFFVLCSVLFSIIKYPTTSVLITPMAVTSLSYFLYDGAPFFTMPLALLAVLDMQRYQLRAC